MHCDGSDWNRKDSTSTSKPVAEVRVPALEPARGHGEYQKTAEASTRGRRPRFRHKVRSQPSPGAMSELHCRQPWT